jgi:hypothetical protein
MRLFGTIALLAVAALTASATPVTLVLSPVTAAPFYQQTTNNPCVLGDPSCQGPSGWTWTIFESNPPGGAYTNVLSPTYEVSGIRGVVGPSEEFRIGVDVNQTNVVQTLDYFAMIVNGNVVAEFSPTNPVSVPPTSGGGNGNGWADYVLSGFNLSGFADTDLVQFKVTMSLVNDGREQFFLISSPSEQPPPPIPEPTTSALIGGGLAGLGLLLRRRAQKQA